MDQAVLGHRTAQADGQLGRAQARWGDQALVPHDVPVGVGLVEQQHRDAVVADQRLHAAQGRVEHVAQVERGRQGLRHPVQREQQGVRVREPPQSVDGELALPVRLAGDAPGVAGDDRDQQDDRRPRRRQDHRLTAVARLCHEGERDGQDRRDGDPEREAEAPGQAGDGDRGQQREDQRGVPGAGGGDGDDVQRDLGEDPHQRGDVVGVGQRADGPEDRVRDHDGGPDPQRRGDVGGGRDQQQRDRGGREPHGHDQAVEAGDPVTAAAALGLHHDVEVARRLLGGIDHRGAQVGGGPTLEAVEQAGGGRLGRVGERRVGRQVGIVREGHRRPGGDGGVSPGPCRSE